MKCHYLSFNQILNLKKKYKSYRVNIDPIQSNSQFEKKINPIL